MMGRLFCFVMGCVSLLGQAGEGESIDAAIISAGLFLSAALWREEACDE